MKRLIATFRPQAWVHDEAMNIDGKVEFDVTENFLSLSLVEIRSFRENTYDSDELASDLDARWEHSGPFEVDVDLDEWFDDNGIESDRKDLTQEELDMLRERFGVKLAQPGFDVSA